MNDNENLNIPNIIEDDKGDKWTLDRPLGQGGQGIVYRTKDANIAVKLVLDQNGNIVEDENKYEKFSNAINDVVIIKCDEDVTVCKPLRMLKKPICGYIMHLLSDLEPLEKLMFNSSKNTLEEYLTQNCGLNIKLQVLIELSRVLAKIHSQGLVYSDLSPNNVFYSPSAFYSKVWLIDCDNLHYISSKPTAIFTPSYGAPEVASRAGINTQFSDCFSFAVIAYKLLVARHPFEQDYTEISSSDGWDASTTSNQVDNIEANDTLWICDEEHKNYSDNKKFTSMFVTNKLFELFDKTFNKTGRKIPSSRPSMRAWYNALLDAYHKIWKCEQCQKYFMLKNRQCIICDEPVNIKWYYSEVTQLSVDLFNKINEQYIKLKESEDFNALPLENFIKGEDIPIFDGKIIFNYELSDTSIDTSIKPILSFKIVNDYLEIHNYENYKINYIQNNSSAILLSDKKIYKDQNITVFFKIGNICKILKIKYNE